MPIPLGILAVAGAGAAGGGGSFDLLETTVLSSSASSVTFTNLGNYSAYKHLQLRLITQSTNVTSYNNVYLRFNGDSGSNYASHTLQGSGTSVISQAATSSASGTWLGYTNGNTNIFGTQIVDILDFSSSNKNTTTRSFTGFHDATNRDVGIFSGFWNNTAAVTSIEVRGTTFAANSRFSLYGIK